MKKLLFALLLTAAAQAAPVVNGGFETGDFAGWTVSNPTSASVVSNVGNSGSGFGGNFHAQLRLVGNNPLDSTSVADLETFLNLEPGCLTGDNILFGTAIKQAITLTADQEINLDFHWLGNYATFPDSGSSVWFTLGNGTGTNIFITPVDFGTSITIRDGFVYSYNDQGQTQLFDRALGEDGAFTMGILLAHEEASVTPDTALAFDNVALVPDSGVPEISGAGGWQAIPLLLGLLLAGENRRRRG